MIYIIISIIGCILGILAIKVKFQDNDITNIKIRLNKLEKEIEKEERYDDFEPDEYVEIDDLDIDTEEDEIQEIQENGKYWTFDNQRSDYDIETYWEIDELE